MLEAMRSLALDFLFQKIGDGEAPGDLNNWFQKIRNSDSSNKVFPYLVEDIEKIERVYTIYPDKDKKDLAHLDVRDLTNDIADKLPFKQRREKAIGPVVKRTSKGKGLFGPEQTTQKLTLEYFARLANSSLPWSKYFGEIDAILRRPRIKILSQQTIETGEGKQYPNIYAAAIAMIPEVKGTVFLTVADYATRLPGERQEYMDYLSAELARLKYSKESNPYSIIKSQVCPLCGSRNVTVYSKAVTGAGLNITNEDRIGAFPRVKAQDAWKAFALCIDCADLLYIYKNHVHKKFLADIAGGLALLIPYTSFDGKLRQKFIKHVEEKYMTGITDGVARREEMLLSILAQEPAVTNITILWAKFGQNIEDLRGIITDILPSRLGGISRFNQEAQAWKHPLFPVYPITNFNLAMTCLFHVFKRPGRKKAKQINASSMLFEMKRKLLSALYHEDRIDEEEFWREIMTTARWYLTEALIDGSGWGILNEGVPKDKKEHYLTMAGWIKHVAHVVYYLRKMGVFSMGEKCYEPRLDDLKPYFGSESGIDDNEKAFAFLLGILYGKVIQVQAARRVNVGANALTWLRRLTLSGKDLPELYVKVREKLLAYEAEGNEKVRSVIEEVGHLGTKLGSNINLDETNTCYFLLLGQSMTTTIIPSKTKNND